MLEVRRTFRGRQQSRGTGDVVTIAGGVGDVLEEDAGVLQRDHTVAEKICPWSSVKRSGWRQERRLSSLVVVKKGPQRRRAPVVENDVETGRQLLEDRRRRC